MSAAPSAGPDGRFPRKMQTLLPDTSPTGSLGATPYLAADACLLLCAVFGSWEHRVPGKIRLGLYLISFLSRLNV